MFGLPDKLDPELSIPPSVPWNAPGYKRPSKKGRVQGNAKKRKRKSGSKKA